MKTKKFKVPIINHWLRKSQWGESGIFIRNLLRFKSTVLNSLKVNIEYGTTFETKYSRMD